MSKLQTANELQSGLRTIARFAGLLVLRIQSNIELLLVLRPSRRRRHVLGTLHESLRRWKQTWKQTRTSYNLARTEKSQRSSLPDVLSTPLVHASCFLFASSCVGDFVVSGVSNLRSTIAGDALADSIIINSRCVSTGAASLCDLVQQLLSLLRYPSAQASLLELARSSSSL